MASTEADLAARLIERLLADPSLRARFRRDPAAACREAGLDELADEMSLGAGKAMYTLDVRESKSSLAGVMMAAAMEGVGIYEFSEHVLPHLEEVPGHVADVLSRVDLPVIGGGGGHGAAATAEAATPGGGGGHAASAASDAAATPGGKAPDTALPSRDVQIKHAVSSGSGGKHGAAASGGPAESKAAAPAQSAAPAQPQPTAPAEPRPAAPAGGSSGGGKAADGSGVGGGGSVDSTGGGTATDSSGGGGGGRGGGGSGVGGGGSGVDGGGSVDSSGGGTTTAGGGGSRAGGGSGVGGGGSVDSAGSGSGADAATPGGGSVAHHIDPSQFGQGGTGGPPSPETVALLHDKNVVFDADGIADLKAGRIDPRVVAILTHLGQHHKIVVSCMCSDHPKFTSGGSVSNHSLGRGVDIASVDGQTVNAGNPIARDIAGELSSVESQYRPDEIGSPWAISGPGYFTDAEHQNHLHIGFKEPIAPDWTPPPDVAAPGDGGTAAAAAGGGATAAAANGAATAGAGVGGGGSVGDGGATPGGAVGTPGGAAVGTPGGAAVGTPGGAAAAPGGSKGTLGFMQAAGAQAAKAHARPGDSLVFLKAADQKAAQPAAVASAAPSGDSAAAAFDVAGGPDQYPGDNAPRDQIAAWMAQQAQKRGLPPQLPVMASLVESGMRNLNYGDRDSVGFFQMRVGTWNEGPYTGFADKPELQVKWFLDQAEAVKKQRIAEGKSITDPHQFGEWIADVERPAEQYRGRYQLQLDNANALLKSHAQAAPAPAAAAPAPAQAAPSAAAVVDAPTGGAAGGSPLGAAALKIAETQKGVHEIGSTNTGPQVDRYLEAAGVSPGNPWCASFVTWSLEHAGHKMPGSGWAAVSTWVHNAEQGANGLKIVSADQARPGDIVAYDWGGGNDFSSDGHIGFLASNVNGGQFNALEGNNADAVNLVPRHLGGGPNIVFIRVEGNASPGAAAAAAPAQVASAAAAPGAPAAAAAPPADPAGAKGTLVFHQAVQAHAAVSEQSNATLSFMKPAAAPAAASPAGAAPAGAAAPTPSGDGAASAIDFTGGPDQYPGDNASRDQIAAWLAAQAQKRGLPPELPVMASLVESGMRNLNYGDRDSVGFFQMRVGTWNEGPYTGFPDKPELQVKWFLDQAEAVKKQRIAEGKSVTDPNQFGEWIADIERPAEQYRGRYQLQLHNAQELLKSHSKPGPAPAASVAPAPAAAPADAAAPAPAAPVTPDAHLPAAVADAVAAATKAGEGPGPRAMLAIEEASKYIGTPYHFGGSTPQTGFDCSGLMQWAYAHAGIKLPRVSEQQILASNGTPVDRDHLRPGDLVFFDEGGDIGHVGMYIGHDEILHAPHTGDVVKVASLDDAWFVQHFAGGRRFDQGAAVAAQAAAAPAPAAAVDPAEVASAHAAVARDAAEVQRPGTLLFKAVKAQEARKERMTVQFLKAIDPSQMKRPAAAAATPGAPATPAPAAPATPADAATPAAAPADAATPSGGSVVDAAGAASDYPGDNASQAEIAKWMAKQAQKAGLPPELPVMASLVESGVKNLNYGDADSVGFFQMRVGIWNKGEYAGFPHKPELQIKWFIDHALAVKRQAIASGNADFGKDPGKYGDWVADVEQPFEAYRGRYQLRLDQARALLSG